MAITMGFEEESTRLEDWGIIEVKSFLVFPSKSREEPLTVNSCSSLWSVSAACMALPVKSWIWCLNCRVSASECSLFHSYPNYCLAMLSPFSSSWRAVSICWNNWWMLLLMSATPWIMPLMFVTPPFFWKSSTFSQVF